MGKKIVLIAVVICLDLAFIMIMRDGGKLVDLSQSIETPAVDPALTTRKPAFRQTIPVTSKPEQPMSDERAAIDESQVRPARLKRSVSDEVSRKAYLFRKTQNRPERFPAYDRAPEKFTDTIIWYERASYGRDDGPERVAVTTTKATKDGDNVNRKKKSLLDRALPVVKKPYQWIKSLVTKL
jgi:hypothetical protein